MSDRFNALAQQILAKPSLEECDLDELESLATRFPYYAPVQFLLAEKHKTTTAEPKEPVASRAVLFYPDPLRFHHLFSSSTERPVDLQLDNNSQTESVVEIQPGRGQPEDVAILTGPITQLSLSPHDSPNALRIALVPDAAGKSRIDAEYIIVEDAPVELEQDFALHADTVDDKTITSEDQLEIPALKSEEILPIAVAPVTEELFFEPYHTVDYFASQGIKINVDEAPKDKLTAQLKSFTQWLKTMKKLPATAPPIAPDAIADEKVERLATISLSDADVVTEAMAEVWAGQGNKAKAIDTYLKLSLLNPSKKRSLTAKFKI